MAAPSVDRITRRPARAGKLAHDPASGRFSPAPQVFSITVRNRTVPVWKLRDVDLRLVSPIEMGRVLHAVWTAATGSPSNQAARRWAIRIYPRVRDLHTKQLSILAADEAVSVFKVWMGQRRSGVEAQQMEDLWQQVSQAVEASIKPVLEVAEAAPAPETEAPVGHQDFGDPGAPSPELKSAMALLEQRQDAAIGELLRRPDMLSPEEFADRINLSRQRLNQWRQEGKALAIEGAKRGFRYPAWQVGPEGKIFGTAMEVLNLFGAPLPTYRFLMTPLDLLGGKAPRELLGGAEEGRIVELAEAAVRGDYL